MNNSTAKRFQWIDCSKAIAMLAVVMDHSTNVFFRNHWLSTSSYFAVSLFVMLSGLTLSLKHDHHPISFIHQLKKVFILFIHYAAATLLYLLYNSNFSPLSISDYLFHLFHFDTSGHFFFLLFFFQLELIAPFLLKLFSTHHRSSLTVHLLVLLVLIVFASFSVQKTYILPVYGGGKHLFGGTYLVVFYIGILLGRFFIKPRSRQKLLSIFAFSSCGGLAWLYLFGSGRLRIDQLIAPYFGVGFDPPSLHFLIFTLFTFFACYSLFSFLDSVKNRFIHLAMYWFAKYGRYTLHVYLYHQLVRMIIWKHLPHATLLSFPFNIIGYVTVAFIPFIFFLLFRTLYQPLSNTLRSSVKHH